MLAMSTIESAMTSCDSVETATELPLVSVVVIGRNEGERLMRCFDAIERVDRSACQLELIYVDSDSTDGSPLRAAERGVQVIPVKPLRPSAALGRNAGWRAARGECVMFLDGDTELHPDFLRHALAAMHDPAVAIVWGHRRESNPGQSWYVRVLDLDWIYPPGDTTFCGGDALMRRSVLEAVQGFDETLIAGEEPEMCRRVRATGKRIVHLDVPMTLHDLAVNTWKASWRRAFRAGHAYEEVSARFRGSEDALWAREARRNLLHAAAMVGTAGVTLLLLALLPAAAGALVLLAWLGVSGLLLWRTARRCAWKSGDPATRWMYAVHSHLQQIPIALGQLARKWDVMRGRRRQLIEYKQSAGAGGE